MSGFQPEDCLILVVDDIPQNLQVVGDMLDSVGYGTTFATSGKQAIERIKTAKPDLILLDLMMPEMNGLQVCQILKSDPIHQDLPIIFLTASNELKHLLEAFSQGAVDYVTKPFNAPELLARVKTHLELKKARESALEVARLKTEFLATMSHEIRTPMNAVLGVSELLLKTELNEQQRDFVETLKASSENLLMVVNDILDFSKLEAGEVRLEKTSVDLNQLLEEVIDLFSSQVNTKKIELVYLIDPKIPKTLIGDYFRIKQILINLVSNAIKFTTIGEILITINLSHNHRHSNPIKLIFSVKDTGRGISEIDQHQLFRSFAQVGKMTPQKYGGTGLGLTICKQLVQLMKGEIGIESELNKGSTFWFNIPLKFQQDESENYSLEIKNKTIMILTQHLLTGKMLENFCQSQGLICYSLHHYHTIKKFYQEIKNHKFDAIIIDSALLDKQNNNDLKTLFNWIVDFVYPCIIVSPLYQNIASRQNPLSLLIQGQLNKPLKISRLRDCLSEVLQGKSYGYENEGLILNALHPQIEHPFKILVVEDTPLNQKVLLKQLASLGYNGYCVENGEKALEAISKSHYNLVLMDCQMPILNGYETTKRIRSQEKENHHLIIVGLTAYAMKGDREKCLSAGMDDYLSKPVSLEALSRLLEKWLLSSPVTRPVLDVTTISSMSVTKGTKYQSPIDEDRLYAMVCDNRDVAQEILKVFIYHTAIYLQEIREALRENKTEQIIYRSHQIKGSSATLAIRFMPELSSRLETMARSSNLDSAEELVVELEQVFDRVRAFVEE